MILYVDKDNRVIAVNHTTDNTLTPIEVPEDSKQFDGWSEAKICCYRVKKLENGQIVVLSPYIDVNVVNNIDKLGQQNITLQAQVDYLSMMTDVEMM